MLSSLVLVSVAVADPNPTDPLGSLLPSGCERPVVRAMGLPDPNRWVFEPSRLGRPPRDASAVIVDWLPHGEVGDGVLWLSGAAPVRGELRLADGPPRVYVDGVALRSDLEGPADRPPIRPRARLPGAPALPARAR